MGREWEKPRLPGEGALIWALERENDKVIRQGGVDRSGEPVKMSRTAWHFEAGQTGGVLCRIGVPGCP